MEVYVMKQTRHKLQSPLRDLGAMALYVKTLHWSFKFMQMMEE